MLEGPAAEEIIDLACREQVDLIVMCTHGRSGLSRWIYGSVANKVLQHAPCPVFLVKAAEKASSEPDQP
jgi:nucleotide-binding universal stress UspA family protein